MRRKFAGPFWIACFRSGRRRPPLRLVASSSRCHALPAPRASSRPYPLPPCRLSLYLFSSFLPLPVADVLLAFFGHLRSFFSSLLRLEEGWRRWALRPTGLKLVAFVVVAAVGLVVAGRPEV